MKKEEKFSSFFLLIFMGEMIISAVAIRNARKLANGYRSPIPPHRLFLFHKNKNLTLENYLKNIK